MRKPAAIAVTVLAATLSGCTRDPNVSNHMVSQADQARPGRWLIDRQTDRITGKPISYVSLRATKTATDAESNTLFFARNVLMELMCFRDVPTARFAFNYTVGSEKNSTLGWRFDDKPGKEGEARILRDYKTVIIDQPAEMKPFLEQMVTSRTLYIRVFSLNDHRNSAEFELEGAREAVAAAFADCPFPEPEPPPPPRTKRKRTT